MKIVPNDPNREAQIKAAGLTPQTPGKLRVLEPHEWNAELLKRQKARGEEPNIPKPQMDRYFTVTTKKPKLRDLREEKRQIARGEKPQLPGIGGVSGESVE